MAILPIMTAPDPRLKKICKAVKTVDDNTRRLMDDMRETMNNAPGIGLAAPQVGALQRIIVVDVVREGEDPDPHFMVNPELTWVSDHDVNYEEGCLSLPEEYADVVRPAEIKVRFLDREGKKTVLEAEGLLATCIQHEIDHLDGILFVDHISALRRNMILRRLLKAKRSEKPVAKYATA